MKVLHLLNSDRFSGAENVVCQIISMFKNELDIEMVYCSRDGQIREVLNERNISFVSVDDLTVKEVKRVLKEVTPDVIHAHDMRASFIAALSCGRIPLISHIHNNAFDSRGISLKSIAYLYAAFKSKHIFWVSKSSFSGYFFCKFFIKKSEVLYNVIDINTLYEKMKLDSNKYDYDIVYIGRLTYQKNPQRLFNVLKLVVDKRPYTKIAIIGTGELDAEIKKLCLELQLNDNVCFFGHLNNPLKVLHDSKVMLMTSRWEGTPMCALEAMALGVPIVSTKTDGLCELIEQGKNGYLCNNNDDIEKYILKLLDNSELQKSCSNNAYNKALKINDIENYKKNLAQQYAKSIL